MKDYGYSGDSFLKLDFSLNGCVGKFFWIRCYCYLIY